MVLIFRGHVVWHESVTVALSMGRVCSASATSSPCKRVPPGGKTAEVVQTFGRGSIVNRCDSCSAGSARVGRHPWAYEAAKVDQMEGIRCWHGSDLVTPSRHRRERLRAPLTYPSSKTLNHICRSPLFSVRSSPLLEAGQEYLQISQH